MQISNTLSRQTMTSMKGNHRRIIVLGAKLLWGYEKYL